MNIVNRINSQISSIEDDINCLKMSPGQENWLKELDSLNEKHALLKQAFQSVLQTLEGLETHRDKVQQA